MNKLQKAFCLVGSKLNAGGKAKGVILEARPDGTQFYILIESISGEYVTYLYDLEANACYFGNYFSNYEEAVNDYLTR